MAMAYVCDACGVTITDPYYARMKMFYRSRGVGISRKEKIHLCSACYSGLCKIAEEKMNSEKHTD